MLTLTGGASLLVALGGVKAGAMLLALLLARRAAKMAAVSRRFGG